MRGILLPLLAAALSCAACRDLEVVTAVYATLNEARAAGAIERGWIPEGLPQGTHDIREAHDLDSNRRWGLFSFPHDQDGALRALLEPGELSFDALACDIPARIEWWPVLLRGRLDDERIRATGLEAYRAASGDLVFAVNWKQGRAYYWTFETAAAGR
ncbi:MAG TPA: hypothetical protein VLD67_03370 [Vicinamibacterales bacterium]|nr:hypothetical protein [Vicinamibacterales bacterium]